MARRHRDKTDPKAPKKKKKGEEGKYVHLLFEYDSPEPGRWPLHVPYSPWL